MDPIGFQGQELNLFAAVNNSPLLFSDPTGNVSTPDYDLTINESLRNANIVRCTAFSALIFSGLVVTGGVEAFTLEGSRARDNPTLTAGVAAGAFLLGCAARGVGQSITITLRRPDAIRVSPPTGGLNRLLFILGRTFGRTVGP